MEELQGKCNAILDSSSIGEDERIEQVEALVLQELGDAISAVERERLVLDILWHHRGHTSSASKPRRVIKKGTFGANSPLLRGPLKPLPSDPSKLLESSGGEKVKRKPEKIKISRQEFQEWSDRGDNADAELGALSPYDILRQVLGANSKDSDIKRELARNDYDISKTLSQLTMNVSEKKVLCKYFVQFGECFRSDCMYDHDMSSRICRYWLQGACLAGSNCMFLHEIPTSIVENLKVSDLDCSQQKYSLNVKDTEEFPSLGARPAKTSTVTAAKKKSGPAKLPSKKFSFKADAPVFVPSTFAPEAVGSATTSPVASPHTPPVALKPVNRMRVAISKPKRVPWEQPSFGKNQQYIAHRRHAARHADMRNKYLQLAVDSYYQNDPATAKRFSQKGQDNNEKMFEHYELANEILTLQNKEKDSEIYFDMHTYELDEATGRLEEFLREFERDNNDTPKPVYVICGIGRYYRRTEEDMMSKSVKDYLNKWGYEFKEFAEDPKFGKVIGVDPWSHV